MESSTRGCTGQDFLVPASHKHPSASLCVQEMEFPRPIQKISNSPSEGLQTQAMVHSLYNGKTIMLL